MPWSPLPEPVADLPPPAAAVRREDATVGPRYGLLLLAAAASIGVQGIASPSGVQQLVVTALSGAALVLAVRGAQLAPRLLRLALALAVVAVAVAAVRAAGGGVGDGAARAMNAALLAFGPPAVAVGVMRDLRATGRVRFAAVLGVLSLYLLLGLLFAFVYGAIDRLTDHALFAGGLPADVSRCIYYSFTTLATVGYGDVVTQTQLGHTLSIFEALLGQIYLVTVVSMLVSNIGQPRPGGR
ncbi:MAG TPA: potassium channel family protein [Baekduia sp.]|nr:potassium channel family protein [Baekduia sp.]